MLRRGEAEMLKDGNAEDRARRSEDGGRPPAQRGPTPRWEISRLATASPSIGGHGDFVRWRRGQRAEGRDPLAQIHFFLLRTSWRKLGELADAAIVHRFVTAPMRRSHSSKLPRKPSSHAVLKLTRAFISRRFPPFVSATFR